MVTVLVLEMLDVDELDVVLVVEYVVVLEEVDELVLLLELDDVLDVELVVVEETPPSSLHPAMQQASG